MTLLITCITCVVYSIPVQQMLRMLRADRKMPTLCSTSTLSLWYVSHHLYHIVIHNTPIPNGFISKNKGGKTKYLFEGGTPPNNMQTHTLIHPPPPPHTHTHSLTHTPKTPAVTPLDDKPPVLPPEEKFGKRFLVKCHHLKLNLTMEKNGAPSHVSLTCLLNLTL